VCGILSDPTVAHHAYNTHESHDHVKLLCDSDIKPRRRETNPIHNYWRALIESDNIDQNRLGGASFMALKTAIGNG
jgi:hypothetical protein